MKRIVTAFIALFIFASLFAQQTWEGNAAMSRYGEFPSTGLYGASDSFSRNTVVTVENLENNKKTTIIIVERLDDPGLFLLLSREAALELGISPDQFVRTRVTLADARSRLSVNDEDQAYHDDPDINPSARIEDEDLSFLNKYLTSDEPLFLDPEADPGIVQEDGDQDDAETITEEAPVQEEPPAVIEDDIYVDPGPDAVAIADAEPLLEESPVPSAVPEPRLSEPEPEPVPPKPEVTKAPPVYEEPRLMLTRVGTAVPDGEDLPSGSDLPRISEAAAPSLYVDNTNAQPDADTADIAISDEPDLTEEEQRAILIAQQFPLPRPEIGDSLNDIVPQAPRLETPRIADLDGTPPSEGTGSYEFALADPKVKAVEEEPLPGDVVVTLEKAEPRPPAVSDEAPEETVVEEDVQETQPEVPVPAAAPEPQKPYEGTFRVVQRLDGFSHYLQIGAYREAYSAEAAARRFNGRYPVTLLEASGIFRVLLGPLTPDESGALLLTVRSLGYRDAFIQRGH
ncbi:MAG: hypothetical protein JXB03_09730 [Spirochaetales bacterium]|nr:hypothetical protein [Spirochaetales bacterium]